MSRRKGELSAANSTVHQDISQVKEKINANSNSKVEQYGQRNRGKI
ncbi:hypothetical protein P4U90_20210 [Cytobacillus kochii]|nr:hypothetical protein [Cytobacillus kochii]